MSPSCRALGLFFPQLVFPVSFPFWFGIYVLYCFSESMKSVLLPKVDNGRTIHLTSTFGGLAHKEGTQMAIWIT